MVLQCLVGWISRFNIQGARGLPSKVYGAFGFFFIGLRSRQPMHYTINFNNIITRVLPLSKEKPT